MNKILDPLVCQHGDTEVVGCAIMYCGRQEHAALSSGQKMKMEYSTKMFITIYQIMWCHIVNFNETHTQRVLPSPKMAPDNKTLPTPQKRKREDKFTKFCAERDRNHLQCVKPYLQPHLFCISMSHDLKLVQAIV